MVFDIVDDAGAIFGSEEVGFAEEYIHRNCCLLERRDGLHVLGGEGRASVNQHDSEIAFWEVGKSLECAAGGERAEAGRVHKRDPALKPGRWQPDNEAGDVLFASGIVLLGGELLQLRDFEVFFGRVRKPDC